MLRTTSKEDLTDRASEARASALPVDPQTEKYSFIHNDTLRTIRERRSVGRFTSEPVTNQQLQTILDAGRWAPSALNSQPWDFVVVSDQKIRAGMASILEWTTLRWKGFAAAPEIIVVSVDQSLDPEHFVEDGAVAAQNMCLAAQSLGLASSWAGIYAQRARRGSAEGALKLLLALPRTHRIIAVIPIGFAAYQQRSSRRPLAELVHRNHYGVLPSTAASHSPPERQPLQAIPRLKGLAPRPPLEEELASRPPPEDTTVTRLADNPTLRAIRERRSVRNFTTDPVTDQQLETILEAGRWAPSALNSQPWDFVVVDDQQIRADICVILRRVTWAWGGFATSPALIVVAVDESRDPKHFVEDGAVAAQNMCLAAQSLGLASSWAGVYSRRPRRGGVEDALKNLVSLPRTHRIIAVVPVGVARHEGHPLRRPLAEMVHYDRFHPLPKSNPQAPATQIIDLARDVVDLTQG